MSAAVAAISAPAGVGFGACFHAIAQVGHVGARSLRRRGCAYAKYSTTEETSRSCLSSRGEAAGRGSSWPGGWPSLCAPHKSKGAVVEKTVPIQNDFPTYEKQECDRSKPKFRGSSISGARSWTAPATADRGEAVVAVLFGALQGSRPRGGRRRWRLFFRWSQVWSSRCLCDCSLQKPGPSISLPT